MTGFCADVKVLRKYNKKKLYKPRGIQYNNPCAKA